MIKVNLLRNTGSKNKKSTATEINYETSFQSEGDGGSEAPKDVLLKFVVMLIGIGGLMAYEGYNIGELNTRLLSGNAKKSALTQEIEVNRPIAEKARTLQANIQELENRIKTIKDLSRIRLREIKSIDYIQNVIPEKVWLISLAFTGENLSIEGGATSDEQLNKFMESLEKKSYFKNVILLKSVEQKAKDGTMKMFTITSSLINAD